MVFILSSCADEIVPKQDENIPGSGKEVPITLDLKDLFANGTSTYGINPPGGLADGTAAEDKVNDVVVYVFDNLYYCEKIMHATTSPIQNPIGPVMVKAGIKHFIVVVNGEGKLTLETTTPASVNYAGLLRTVTDQHTLPASPFLMTGLKNNVVIPENRPDTSPENIPVEVIRACAKATLTVTKRAKAESHDIIIKEITLINGADRVPLFNAPPPPDPVSYTLTETKTVASGSGVVTASPNYLALTDTFYTYESLCGTDKTKAVRFEIKTLVDNANERTAGFYLATDATGSDSVFDVKRNHWYNIKVDIIDPGMDSVYVTINACPWNLADTQKVVSGGGYEVVETAQPFKLVKNYTAAELNGNEKYAAIDKHSKGASWIKFMVSDGYPWKLEFTGKPENNINARMNKFGETTWASRVSGMGVDGDTVKVYIYRPYVENAEPKSGPTFSLTVGGTLEGNGDVTGGTRVRDFVVQPRDTTPIPTNCFILRPQLAGVPFNETHVYIPLKGVYRYWEDYLLENGKTIFDVVGGDVDAVLLWQDREFPGNDVVKNLNIINGNNPDQSYLYAEAGPVQGNAVVAMQFGTKIVWSFHLWVTEYNPYEAAGQKLSVPSSTIFMDRNLGAMNNKYDSEGEARGLFYQYGRKDPFPRSPDWSNVSNATMMWWGPESNSSGRIPAVDGGTLSYALRPLRVIQNSLQYPTHFFRDDPNWLLSADDTCLWNTAGGNKTAFDPCPEGWRIPKQASMLDGDNTSPWRGHTLDPNQSGRYHPGIGYYPFSGYLSPDGGSAAIRDVDVSAYFWTSYKGSETTGTGLMISNGTYDPVRLDLPINKHYGVSVRCVVDRNYLINTGGGGLFGSGAGDMENEIL